MHWLKPPVDDGRPIAIVNPWSRDKHHFLRRYVDAFTVAMKRKKWSGLHYIDLFSGPGIERIESTGELDWGSPLIAAQSRQAFTRLHLCEKDIQKHAALKHRLEAMRPPVEHQLLLGDANEVVSRIVTDIPARALSLAFLDPFGLHLSYQTLAQLARIRADLILYFPLRIDVERNWNAYYFDNPNSKLDDVLGPDSDWRAKIAAATEPRGRAFLNLYEQQIRKLGFKHFEWEPIPSGSAAMYYLIFCSKDEAGRKIWRNVAEKKPDGQRTFLLE